MSYFITYEPDYPRFLPAMIIENRALIPEIKNQVGNVIKAYTDSKVSLIGYNSIFYKVETENGVIAGVFSIDINTGNKTAQLNIMYLRPAFLNVSTDIQGEITNFINSKVWQQDYLFLTN